MSFMKWMSGNVNNSTGGALSSGGSILGNGSNGAGRDGWPDNDDRYFGLVNVGNICYCSSVLQSLYFCRAFRECVNNYPYPRKMPVTLENAALQRRQEQAITAKPIAAAGAVGAAGGGSGPNALQTLERSVSVLTLSGSTSPGNEHLSGSLATMYQRTNDNSNSIGKPTSAGFRNPSSGNDPSSGRSKALSSIKERAAGLRRKKDKRNNDSGTASALDSTPDGFAESRSENLPPLISADNASGGNAAQTIHPAVATPAVENKAKPGNAETQQQKERSIIDALTEDISSSALYKIDSTMFTELKDLFWLISTRVQRTGSLSPQGFIAKLKESNELFRSNAHQDGHEFLIYLLNEIVENVEKIQQEKGIEGCTGAPLHGPNQFRGNTWVHTLFEGLLTNETRCLSCENVTSQDEKILDVSVDIHENTSVTNCLNQFAAGELLCHNDKFYCDNCGGLQEAERRMRLKRLPNILALHLKRFKYHKGLGRYVKLSYRVNFPTELRVPNTTEETEDVLYSLSAIVVHLGGGLVHGHYISIVRSGDKWVLFDDDCVEIIKENELSNYFGDFPNFGSGYVLFYERTDFDPMRFDLPRSFHPPASSDAAAPATNESSVAVVSASASSHTNGLHSSITMPNLAASALVPSSLSSSAATPGPTNRADSTKPKFTEPRRPPPLIATTRSMHGGIMDPAQMSPGVTTPGAMTPTRLTPAASTPSQMGSFFSPMPVNQGSNIDPSQTMVSTTFSSAVSQQPSSFREAGPIMLSTADTDQAYHNSKKDGNVKAEADGNSAHVSKSRSWFGRRSKK